MTERDESEATEPTTEVHPDQATIADAEAEAEGTEPDPVTEDDHPGQ